MHWDCAECVGCALLEVHIWNVLPAGHWDCTHLDIPFRYIIIPHETKFRGVYWIHPVRPSVCLSVRPSIRGSVSG